MTTQPMLYRRGSQLRILPRHPPERISAVITFAAAARLGRHDSRLPECLRSGYRHPDTASTSGRHRMEM
ncbi:hypothetical protein ACIGO9_28710 [Nocardia asteroides]|uniref:hypothetical protein n=1 Tax=Nocardia asteroides TaxID=1824 RepID=UPI0037CC6EF4